MQNSYEIRHGIYPQQQDLFIYFTVKFFMNQTRCQECLKVIKPVCIEFHCCPTVVRVFGVSMRTSCTESEVGVKRICFYKLKLARSLCSCG